MPYTSFFSAALFWTSLKWLIIAGTWTVLTFGIFRKDRIQRESLNADRHPSDVTTFLKLLYKRNVQLWGLVTLLMVAGVASDIRRDTPLPITTSSDQSRLPLTDAEPSALSTQKANLIPITSSPLPYLDVTEFNEKDSKEQAYIDILKGRYEAWLVTYYYLNKCGKAETQDFQIIHNALKKELVALHAESGVENNILLAAAGSYKEMYSNIPCDDGHLINSKATYDVNMQQLKKVSRPAGVVKP